jgi:malonate transporter and related proteins
MLFVVLNIVAPVFLVIGSGWLSMRMQLFNDSMVDGLMKFATQLAVPCLLFRAISRLDLSTAYNWNLLSAFYIGATVSFFSASLIMWKLFQKKPGESIAIGFGALFSNSVLLGLPISERAWGVENISPVYAIVSIHAPFCYLLGISCMELLRSDGRSLFDTGQVVVKSMFRNSLMIGIGLGFLVNLSGLQLPAVLLSAVDILSESALPVALFGLGAVLTRYKINQTLGEVGTISVFSLIIHPGITFVICYVLGVPESISRMAVLVAAMAPGINSYLFANMYERGQGVAASTVVLATSTSVFSISVWVWLLT